MDELKAIVRRLIEVVATLGLVVVMHDNSWSANAPGTAETSSAEPGFSASKRDQVLAQWERRSSTIGTVDVRFACENRSVVFTTPSHYAGRAVLKGTGYAWLEVWSVEEGGRTRHPYRVIWARSDLHLIQYDDRSCTTFPRRKQDQDRLPVLLELPFLFHIDIKNLKKSYNIDLIAEDVTTYTIRIASRNGNKEEGFRWVALRLNKATFLPETLLVVKPDDRSRQTYRVTDLRLNGPVAEKEFHVREQDGWTIDRSPKPLGESFPFNLLFGEFLVPFLLKGDISHGQELRMVDSLKVEAEYRTSLHAECPEASDTTSLR